MTLINFNGFGKGGMNNLACAMTAEIEPNMKDHRILMVQLAIWSYRLLDQPGFLQGNIKQFSIGRCKRKMLPFQ